jgi:hypothetical protein
VFDGQILVVLVLFSFCGESESGGRGLVGATPVFMAVFMVVSTLPVVLAMHGGAGIYTVDRDIYLQPVVAKDLVRR